MVKKGSFYKHFKGDIYKVICVGYHSETQEKMVVYKNIETDKVCIRPYDMFISDVDKEKYPDVKQQKRFELIKRKNKVRYFWDDYNITSKDKKDKTKEMKESYEKGFSEGKVYNND